MNIINKAHVTLQYFSNKPPVNDKNHPENPKHTKIIEDITSNHR